MSERRFVITESKDGRFHNCTWDSKTGEWKTGQTITESELKKRLDHAWGAAIAPIAFGDMWDWDKAIDILVNGKPDPLAYMANPGWGACNPEEQPEPPKPTRKEWEEWAEKMPSLYSNDYSNLKNWKRWFLTMPGVPEGV